MRKSKFTPTQIAKIFIQFETWEAYTMRKPKPLVLLIWFEVN